MPTNNKPIEISNPTEGIDELLANANPLNSSGDQDDYPEWEPFNVNADPKPLAPELIEGILRKGHKMLIAGVSKAGKSFLLIQLAFSLSEGKPWLGYFKCAKCKVLYVNFEVDRADFDKRLRDICQSEHTNITGTNEYLIPWTLRGRDTSINHFVPILLKRLEKEPDIGAVILDPLYKINTGDENSASEIGAFFREVDKICTERDVSVIMCHHHSKGYQGNKTSIDRSSGSGVFARDPDALLDMIQIDPSTATEQIDLEPGETAWRISFTLRDFRSPEDMEIIFSYPIHRIALELKDADPVLSPKSNSNKGMDKIRKKMNSKYERLVYVVIHWDEIDRSSEGHTKYPTVEDIVKYFKNDKGYGKSTIRNWLNGKNSKGEDLKDFEKKLILKDGFICPLI